MRRSAPWILAVVAVSSFGCSEEPTPLNPKADAMRQAHRAGYAGDDLAFRSRHAVVAPFPSATPLFAAPFLERFLARSATTTWFVAPRDGRARLLVDVGAGELSGFHLPIGGISGSFEFRVTVMIQDASHDSGCRFYLSTRVDPETPARVPVASGLRFSFAISGGGGASGSYGLCLSARWNGEPILDTDVFDPAWRPGRPLDVSFELRRSQATSGISLRIVDRLSQDVWSVPSLALAPDRLPPVDAEWAFGMRAKLPENSGARVLVEAPRVRGRLVVPDRTSRPSGPSGQVRSGRWAQGRATPEELRSTWSRRSVRDVAEALCVALRDSASGPLLGPGLVSFAKSVGAVPDVSPEVANAVARVYSLARFRLGRRRLDRAEEALAVASRALSASDPDRTRRTRLLLERLRGLAAAEPPGAPARAPGQAGHTLQWPLILR